MSKRKAGQDIGQRAKTRRPNEKEDLNEELYRLQNQIDKDSINRESLPDMAIQYEPDDFKTPTIRRILQFLFTIKPECEYSPEPLWKSDPPAAASATAVATRRPAAAAAAASAAAGAGVGAKKYAVKQLSVEIPDKTSSVSLSFIDWLADWSTRRLNNTLTRTPMPGQTYLNYSTSFEPIRLMPRGQERTQAQWQRIQFVETLLSVLQRIKSVDFHTEFIRVVPNMDINTAKYSESKIIEYPVDVYITLQKRDADENTFSAFEARLLTTPELFEIFEDINPVNPFFSITLLLNVPNNELKNMEILTTVDYQHKLRVIVLDMITIANNDKNIFIYPLVDVHAWNQLSLPLLDSFSWNLVTMKNGLYAFQGTFQGRGNVQTRGMDNKFIFPASWREMERKLVLYDAQCRYDTIKNAEYYYDKSLKK